MTKKTIFYADDDEDDIFIFKQAAEHLNVDVEAFLLGESMLDAMYNPPPHPEIVFIDLNMPAKSGFELIQEIRSSPFFKDIPLVVLSTGHDQRSINIAKRTGADYFITKPPSMSELKTAIEHALSIDWKNARPTISNFYYKKNKARNLN